jgi:sulfite exporter TauE/SafE
MCFLVPSPEYRGGYMLDLSLVFVIGLLGSAHCLGMCGGFALAAGRLPGSPQRRHFAQVLYFLGKTVSYTALGLIAGSGGALLLSSLARYQDVLSVVLGCFLVVVGLSLVGVLRSYRIPLPAPVARSDSGVLAALVRRRTLAGTFGLGILNGLLPELSPHILLQGAGAGLSLSRLSLRRAPGRPRCGGTEGSR